MEHSQKINKGGRPPKVVKRNEIISVRCSLLELKLIENKARNVNLTKSEFLREAAKKTKVISKTIPLELLKFKTDLIHMASNMNQIAKIANSKNFLDVKDQIRLKDLMYQIKEIANQITK